jgi:F-type H+-transporting ATPase subunit a
MVTGAGIARFGILGFLKNLVPTMSLPPAIAAILVPMLFVIELWGLLVKHVVLAMRLFANMFGGHVVLAVVIGFIAETAASALWYGVAPISVFGATALSIMELGIALLQAYIFTFLTALFIGMAVHHH